MDLPAELETAAWRKATCSTGNGGNCIEVAPLSGGRVGIRDTEAPDQAPFVVRPEVCRGPPPSLNHLTGTAYQPSPGCSAPSSPWAPP
ncbi:DUF397 domain-containing protein [Nonomuraea angiospora]|uniref:DUF397 domain-containing protein n=1 Tax=Nonomuraea angiospora TaxID=46172 RepID=UPI0029B03D9A|nr:DUF397 domain-containing protein [Nonomuraea angiospora]MDX3099826.1 DUF397 domain-containing protein [Nonomuraea angiospora]